MHLTELTTRERTILELIAKGLSNEGIATEVSLSLKTVEGVARSVFLKLGLGDADPHENRRVKAVLHYLDVAATGTDRRGRLARDVRDLVARAPFDTLSSLLEDRAHDASERGWVMQATSAWFATIHEDFARAGRLARRAVDLASTSPFGRAVCRGLVGTLDAFVGLAPLDHAHLDGVVAAIDDESADRIEIGHLTANLEIPNWFTFADRFDDAAHILNRSFGLADLDNHERIALRCCQIELDLRRGRWEQCERALAEVFAESAAVGSATGYADSLAARIAAMQGDDHRALGHLRAARAAGFDRGDRSTLWRADAAECLLWLGRGDHHQAAMLAPTLISSSTDTPLRLPSVRWWDFDVIEALHRAGRPADATAATFALERDAHLTQSPTGIAFHRLASGLTQDDPVKHSASLRAGAEDFQRLQLPFEEARALLLLAESDVVDSFEAVACAGRAARIFDALGARPWAQRARSA